MPVDAEATTAVALDRVSRDFAAPDGSTYRAVEDVSLEIAAGAFVAIVGPSGCGKSTLLNMTAGLVAPTRGLVRIAGNALIGLNRQAAYMFQHDALLPWKSVRDNVALGLTLAGLPGPAAQARADEWLRRVGLAAFASHYPPQLSGGMRKRVTMAQNWILDRPIALMDEPFSALDVHTRQRMETELLGLWDEGSPARGSPSTSRRTVLFVTHDLEEAIALADEVVVLSAGPASWIVARYAVALERPRELLDLRTSPAFIDLYRTMWTVLREEVMKSQKGEAVHG